MIAWSALTPGPSPARGGVSTGQVNDAIAVTWSIRVVEIVTIVTWGIRVVKPVILVIAVTSAVNFVFGSEGAAPEARGVPGAYEKFDRKLFYLAIPSPVLGKGVFGAICGG